MSREEALAEAVKWVRYGREQLGRDAELEFSAMDATRSDPDYLMQVVEAVVEAGATTVNLPDTVGYAMPTEFGPLIKRAVDLVGRDAVISVHCHDDLGLAVANTLTAIMAGARQVEVTINGLGERAGNAALEEVVMALAHAVRGARRPHDGRGHRADRAHQPAGELPHRVRHPAQQGHRGPERLRPRVGHPPGRRAQEPAQLRDHDPPVGGPGQQPPDRRQAVRPSGPRRASSRTWASTSTGRGAGRHLPRGHRARGRQKKEVTDADLVALVGQQAAGSIDAPRRTGRARGLERHQQPRRHVAGQRRAARSRATSLTAERTGNGPVDALYGAVDAAVEPVLGWHPQLVDYEIRAVSGGEDAQGQVTVRARRSIDDGAG